jgi:hypothetical protein
MEQVTPVVAVDKAPIKEEAAGTAAATAPRVVNERQLTTR